MWKGDRVGGFFFTDQLTYRRNGRRRSNLNLSFSTSHRPLTTYVRGLCAYVSLGERRRVISRSPSQPHRPPGDIYLRRGTDDGDGDRSIFGSLRHARVVIVVVVGGGVCIYTIVYNVIEKKAEGTVRGRKKNHTQTHTRIHVYV